MDLVLKLRYARRIRGLSQKDVAEISGIGQKTISSFETGQRIGSLKLSQLRKLLSVYGMSEREFFGGTIEQQIAPWEIREEDAVTDRLLGDLRTLPKKVQSSLLRKFQTMLDSASEVHSIHGRRRPSFVRENPEWHMLTSRN